MGIYEELQARGLLAAYQMDNGLRPELLAAEPEVVIEMPEGIQADMEIAAADLPETMTAGEMPEQANVQTEAVSETDFQAEVKPAETVQVKAPEAFLLTDRWKTYNENPEIPISAFC